MRMRRTGEVYRAWLRRRAEAALAAERDGIRIGVILLRLVLLATAALGVAAYYGFDRPPIPVGLNRAAQLVLFGAYLLDVWFGGTRGRFAFSTLPPQRMGAACHVAGLVGAVTGLIGLRIGWDLFEAVVVLMAGVQLWQFNVALSRRLSRPVILLPLSFVTLIAVGALLLKLPLATPPGQPISWLDSLFTMTSAVCVTGLVVRDTGASFTPLGQAIIGVFIQLGGLGIITYGAVLASLLGARMTLREHMTLGDMLQEQSVSSVLNMLRFIAVSTFVIELIGAAAMMPFWPETMGFRQRVGESLFLAASAYCNAGFTLSGDSLAAYRYSMLSHAIVVPLLVVGGLGYPVMHDLWRWVVYRRAARRGPGWRAMSSTEAAGRMRDRHLSLHTRVVLVTTAGLFLFGFVVMTVDQLTPHVAAARGAGQTANADSSQALSVGRIGAIAADASFMSWTSRTAGFNTMPMDDVGPAGRFGLITLMIVGGSPGGTAGGVRTTTLALLILGVIATLRKRDDVEAFGRRIDDSQVRKAGTLAFCFLAVLVLFTLVLSVTEPFPFIKVFFEAVSALSVTGLSLGITADLSGGGKVVIMLAMYVGRIGVMTLLAVLTVAAVRHRQIHYAREDVMLG